MVSMGTSIPKIEQGYPFLKNCLDTVYGKR